MAEQDQCDIVTPGMTEFVTVFELENMLKDKICVVHSEHGSTFFQVLKLWKSKSEIDLLLCAETRNMVESF